jgi:hypothetical protein
MSEQREALSSQRKENPFYPFKSFDQYKLAKDMTTPETLPRERIQRIAVEAGRGSYLHEDTGFKSVTDLKEHVDEVMRCQSLWQMEYPWGKTPRAHEPWAANVHYWRRDSLAVLQEILENPRLADKCVWGPQKVTNAEGDRVYTDLHDTDMWWEMQVHLSLPSTLMSEQGSSSPRPPLHYHSCHSIL